MVLTEEDKRSNKLFVTDSKRFWSRTLQVLITTILAYFIPRFDSINAINILLKWLFGFLEDTWQFYRCRRVAVAPIVPPLESDWEAVWYVEGGVGLMC